MNTAVSANVRGVCAGHYADKANVADNNLWRTARMLLVLGKAVLTGQAISMNVELRGNVLLNHGIEKFGG